MKNFIELIIKFIDDNKNWLFDGLGVSALTALFFLLKPLFASIKGRNGKSPTITVEIEIDTDDQVEFYCVIFKKNKNRKKAFDRKWIESDQFIIQHNAGGFLLEKEEISKKMNDLSDPYKFYMAVPNSPEIIMKYYSRLTDAKQVVTGRGKIDINNNKWRIYFLAHDEPIHPDVYGTAYINHILY